MCDGGVHTHEELRRAQQGAHLSQSETTGEIGNSGCIRHRRRNLGIHLSILRRCRAGKSHMHAATDQLARKRRPARRRPTLVAPHRRGMKHRQWLCAQIRQICGKGISNRRYHRHTIGEQIALRKRRHQLQFFRKRMLVHVIDLHTVQGQRPLPPRVAGRCRHHAHPRARKQQPIDMCPIADLRDKRQVIRAPAAPDQRQILRERRMLGALNHFVDIGVARQHAHGLLVAQHIDARLGPATADGTNQRRGDQHIANLAGGDHKDRTRIHGASHRPSASGPSRSRVSVTPLRTRASTSAMLSVRGSMKRSRPRRTSIARSMPISAGEMRAHT